MTLNDCPRASRFHQRVIRKKPALKTRGCYSMGFIFRIDHAVGRTRCYEILMSWTIYRILLRATGKWPSARSSKGPASNTLGQRLSNLDSFWFSLNHSRRRALTNESNQSRKHTSKAAPHLSFSPERTSLRRALCFFCSVEDETDSCGCFNISHTNIWTTSQTGILDFANVLQVNAFVVYM